MNTTISQAIKEMHLLEFYYSGVRRVVEPHTYGRNLKSAHEQLIAWQQTGKPGDKEDWRHFEVAKITLLRELPQSFANARRGYKKNDPQMSTIYAQL